MRAARIHITIDRLVLRGLAQHQRDRFERGLREELQRLLSDPGLPHRLADRHLPSVRLPRLSRAGSVDAFVIGVRTAQGLVRHAGG